MAHYILIHGAWHGAWCWEKIAPMLQEKGHTVVTPDLPGHGKDKTPVKSITFKHYLECIESHLLAAPQEVILVGHSMAGMVISAVAERQSQKVKRLVYVAGYLPQDGESLYEIASRLAPSRFVKTMKPDNEKNLFDFPAYAMRNFAYQDYPDALFARLLPLFCAEPLAPLQTPVLLTQNFANIPKDYIECLRDHAISIQTQRLMHQATPCRVFSIDCDHSPFYTAPGALVDLLLHA